MRGIDQSILNELLRKPRQLIPWLTGVQVHRLQGVVSRSL